MITLLKDYRYKSGNQFLIDTNVWVFVYAPLANLQREKQQAYAEFLAYIIQSRGLIVLPAFLFFELSNLLFAEAYNTWKYKPENVGKNNKKADFMPTDAYQDYLASTRSVFAEMLKIGARFSDEFAAIDVDSIIRNMGPASFADAYFLAYARKKSLKLVSDDGDLKKLVPVDLELITYKA